MSRPVRFVLMVSVLVAACVREAPIDEPPSAAAAVETMKAAVTDAVVRKDPRLIMALFADDAVVHEPDGRLTEGRGAIEARLAELLLRVQGYSITSRRLETSADLAYDQQTFELTTIGEDGAPRTVSGHQVVVIRRQPDGSWRIVESGSWIVAPSETHIH